MLHVTNGDSAARLVQEAGISGEVLPWRDALHEGPVPADLSLAELSRVRAGYIARQGWADEQISLCEFASRNETLLAYETHDEIVLWFEHDLYDQLQLIQVLSILAAQDLGSARLSLICIDRYPGIDRFFGLGQLNQKQIASLFPGRVDVTDAQLETAKSAWDAFRSPDPMSLFAVAASTTSPLPFLPLAINRFLQEYPSKQDGLGQTERQVLLAIRNDHKTPIEVFAATQAMEQAPFLGDSILWSRLEVLASGTVPLITSERGSFLAPRFGVDSSRLQATQLSLTSAGEAVLDRREDAITLNGIDRWFGAVHLTGHEILWRSDGDQNRISENAREE